MNGNPTITYVLKKHNGKLVLFKNQKPLISYQPNFWKDSEVEADAERYFIGLKKSLSEKSAVFINEIERNRCQEFRRAMINAELRGFEPSPFSQVPLIDLFQLRK